MFGRILKHQKITLKNNFFTWKEVYVLSPSDRIALASSGRKKPELSIKEARNLGLDRVAVVVVTSENGKSRNKFGIIKPADVSSLAYKYTFAIKADGIIIKPIKGVSERYDLADPGKNRRQLSSTFLFPVVEGAQRVSVILTIGTDQTIEKEADPKLFEMQ